MTSMTLLHVAMLVVPCPSVSTLPLPPIQELTAFLSHTCYSKWFNISPTTNRTRTRIADSAQRPPRPIAQVRNRPHIFSNHTTFSQQLKPPQRTTTTATMEAADIAVLDLMSRGTKEQPPKESRNTPFTAPIIDRCHLDESCMKSWLDFCS